jgi:tetratricopeptide (TPR) repeat protein
MPSKKQLPRAYSANAQPKASAWPIPRHWWLTPLAFIALACLLFAVYGPALNSPFIYDDQSCTINNPSIVQLWPLFGNQEHNGPLNPPKNIPTAGRPLVNLTLALNYQLGGFQPYGYHLFNLCVHLLCAMLLGTIVQRTLSLDYFDAQFATASGILAFLIAVLWAIHPLQTETVVYVTQRTELMMGFFYLATFYSSLRYWSAATSSGRTTWLAFATLACSAGMASKEVMVTAPVVVLLFERTLLTGSFRTALRRSWPLYLGLALGWILLLFLNYSQPRASTAGFNLAVTPATWWFTQAKVLWLYLKLVVWPWPLLIHYSLPYLETLSAAWPWLLMTALLVLGTVALLWQRRPAGLAGAWALLILSPTLIVPIVTEVAAERRMYLPLAGILTLAVAGAYALIQRAIATDSFAATQRAQRRVPLSAVAAGAAMLTLVWSLLDAHRLDAYQSALALWQDTVDKQPSDSVAHNNLGYEILCSHRASEAIPHFEQALHLDSQYSRAYSNLGAALMMLGRTDQAIDQLQTALKIDPNYSATHCNLGIAYGMKDRLPEAIDQLQQAIKLTPNYTLAHYNLAYALSNAGRFQDAVDEFQRTLKLEPSYSEAYYHLALAYAQLNHAPEALTAAEKALALARSQGKQQFAQQIQTWLTSFRAQHSYRTEPSPSPSNEPPTPQ